MCVERKGSELYGVESRVTIQSRAKKKKKEKKKVLGRVLCRRESLKP
jgi:hypothetical protein